MRSAPNHPVPVRRYVSTSFHAIEPSIANEFIPGRGVNPTEVLVVQMKHRFINGRFAYSSQQRSENSLAFF